VLPMMSRGLEATKAFTALQDAFGVGTVFPNTMLLTPPPGTNLTSPLWLEAACGALSQLTADVSDTLAEQGVDYTMTADDLTGLMLLQGKCTYPFLDPLLDPADWPVPLPPSFAPYLAALADLWIDRYVKNGATKVSVALRLNPFDEDGQRWIRAMRDAMSARQVYNGTEIGQMELTGVACEQMDGAASTFAAFPKMILVTLAIVVVVIGFAFKSISVPIRAVMCLVWMLAIVFGAAAYIYQHGALEWLGLSAFQPQGGALFWMSPCIAFSIVVGLGLDYDVFFTESVMEAYDRGATAKEAVLRALAHTGQIICAAGVIMIIAFGALLFGSSALNQIAFLLCFGVLIDCFITTKFVIPAICALLSTKANFFPRSRKPPSH